MKIIHMNITEGFGIAISPAPALLNCNECSKQFFSTDGWYEYEEVKFNDPYGSGTIIICSEKCAPPHINFKE